MMAQTDAQTIDAAWLLRQRLSQALKEWLRLEFLHQRAGEEACQRLHDSCGNNSLYSLQLKAFIEALTNQEISDRDFITPLNVNTTLACGDTYHQITFWTLYARVSAMGGRSNYFALANDFLVL